MAFDSVWYFTDLPEQIVGIIEDDLTRGFDSKLGDSKLYGDVLNKKKRDSKNTWIPSYHWVGGFIWHYIMRANRENFLYDLRCIDNEQIQYTRYSKGEFYNWHNDGGLLSQNKPETIGNRLESRKDDYLNENTELVIKLSFSMQLSSPDDYEGGNLQLIDENGNNHIAPRQHGSIILFDSRTKHRVNKVTSGVRKSLVGWVVGPRWK